MLWQFGKLPESLLMNSGPGCPGVIRNIPSKNLVHGLKCSCRRSIKAPRSSSRLCRMTDDTWADAGSTRSTKQTTAPMSATGYEVQRPGEVWPPRPSTGFEIGGFGIATLYDSNIAVENVASHRVATKSGAIREGILKSRCCYTVRLMMQRCSLLPVRRQWS